METHGHGCKLVFKMAPGFRFRVVGSLKAGACRVQHPYTSLQDCLLWSKFLEPRRCVTNPKRQSVLLFSSHTHTQTNNWVYGRMLYPEISNHLETTLPACPLGFAQDNNTEADEVPSLGPDLCQIGCEDPEHPPTGRGRRGLCEQVSSPKVDLGSFIK